MHWCVLLSSVAGSGAVCVGPRKDDGSGPGNRARSTRYRDVAIAGGAHRNRNHDRQSLGAGASVGVPASGAALGRAPVYFPRAGTRKPARTRVALPQVCPGRRPPPRTSYLSRDAFSRPQSPLFRDHKGGIQKGFLPIQQLAVIQTRQQRLPGSQPYAFFFPSPQASPTGRAVGKLGGQIAPPRSYSQNPKNAFDTTSVRAPRTTASISPRLGLRKQILNLLPLLVGEHHAHS